MRDKKMPDAGDGSSGRSDPRALWRCRSVERDCHRRVHHRHPADQPTPTQQAPEVRARGKARRPPRRLPRHLPSRRGTAHHRRRPDRPPTRRLPTALAGDRGQAASLSGQVLAIPGIMPTATPSRAPHAATTSAWKAAMPRRVCRVAPFAARVATSALRFAAGARPTKDPHCLLNVDKTGCLRADRWTGAEARWGRCG